MVESRALLKLRSPKGYRGFESLPHRISNPPQSHYKLPVSSSLRGRGFWHELQTRIVLACDFVHTVHKICMVNPRSKNGGGVHFPYTFERHGRLGRIKKWGDGKFGTYFVFCATKFRNSFRSFEAAWKYLDQEFSRLDADRTNSLALNPIRHDVKTYSELEQILREQGSGATLREAVEFYLNHHQHKKFVAKKITACIEAYLAEERSRNHSALHERTLVRHLGHFVKTFGDRKIHEVAAKEISDWLRNFRQEDGSPWAVKTRISVRGTLVGLFIYSRDILKAVPSQEKTEAQLVKNPQRDVKGEVEIYTPEQMRTLLLTALSTDIALIPALIFGGFQGLRPDEFHGENVQERRDPLQWKAVRWADGQLDVIGKVRSKARRHLPLHPITQAWLLPFKKAAGSTWTLRKSYTYKMRALLKAAGVTGVHDGLRHSYASYRCRHLGNNLPKLAEEMGNSPSEIIKSYKADVSDAEADAWFDIQPPPGYAKDVQAKYLLHQPSRPNFEELDKSI